MAEAIILQLERFIPKIKTISKDNKTYIWDIVRKKYIVLKPEEMVRQLFIRYLTDELNYPKTSIAVEKEVKKAGVSGRFDLVVYNSAFEPHLLIECKSFGVSLNDSIFLQSAIYNDDVKAEYLIITNGISAYCCRLDHASQTINFCKKLPSFQ